MFTEEDVRRKLQEIKPDTSQGPDGIHPQGTARMWCTAELSTVLNIPQIFRKGWGNGLEVCSGNPNPQEGQPNSTLELLAG